MGLLFIPMVMRVENAIEVEQVIGKKIQRSEVFVFGAFAMQIHGMYIAKDIEISLGQDE